jgi:hypothetical protein
MRLTNPEKQNQSSEIPFYESKNQVYGVILIQLLRLPFAFYFSITTFSTLN